MDIKPIETVYNGYRFRSRLEARWAVFFDAMGIEYEYELEGLEVDGVRYLPDFYLPEFRCLFEVKHGGIFDNGVPEESWRNSDDYKKIMAITETVKLRNDNQNFDYIILASGSPFDCITGKSDCGLLFNGIVGFITYSKDDDANAPDIVPLTEIDGLTHWGHIPVAFEELIVPDGERVVFFGKKSYKDFSDSEGNHEVVPIGKRCASLGSLVHGIVPRYRGEPLFNPNTFESAGYIAVDTQSSKGSPLYSACIKARQARFEHGEKPNTGGH